MDNFQRQEIYRLRGQGLGYRSIANRLGISNDSVKGFCRRNNINGPGEIAKLNIQIKQNDNSLCDCCGRKLKLNTRGRSKRFCSDDCRRKWWKHNQDKRKMGENAVYKITCKRCNTEFSSYGNKKRKFCSHECYIKLRFWEEDNGIQSSQNG